MRHPNMHYRGEGLVRATLLALALACIEADAFAQDTIQTPVHVECKAGKVSEVVIPVLVPLVPGLVIRVKIAPDFCDNPPAQPAKKPAASPQRKGPSV